MDDVGDPVGGVRHPESGEPAGSVNQAETRGLITVLDASLGDNRDEKS